VAAIEQLFANRLTHYAESLTDLAKVPSPQTASFLDHFSDIYTISPTGTVTQILKALPYSGVFLGFQFHREIGEFISRAYFPPYADPLSSGPETNGPVFTLSPPPHRVFCWPASI